MKLAKMKRANPDPDRVSYFEPDRIQVICCNAKICQALHDAGFRPKLRALLAWEKTTPDEKALAQVLSLLRDAGLPFQDYPQDWSPAAAFRHLRDLGLISGTFTSITNVGPQRGQPTWEERVDQ